MVVKAETPTMSLDSVNKYFQQQANLYEHKLSGNIWKFLRRDEERGILSMVGDVQGIDILELGCGTGYYAKKLISMGANKVIAVDQCDEMLRNIYTDGITVIIGSAESVSLDQKFNLVLAAGLLEFVADPLAVLKNAYTHTKPGGSLVIMVPMSNFYSLFYTLFHKSHGISIRLYNENILRELFERAGWVMQNIQKIKPFSLVVEGVRC